MREPLAAHARYERQWHLSITERCGNDSSEHRNAVCTERTRGGPSSQPPGEEHEGLDRLAVVASRDPRSRVGAEGIQCGTDFGADHRNQLLQLLAGVVFAFGARRDPT